MNIVYICEAKDAVIMRHMRNIRWGTQQHRKMQHYNWLMSHKYILGPRCVCLMGIMPYTE